MKQILLRGLEKISQQLNLEFGYSAANHSFELGLPLENALQSFFRPYFPLRYGFGSGYIVDKNDTISSQCDWIIWEQINHPKLLAKGAPADLIEWFPFDGVYAVVEVKRTLDIASLNKSIQQIAKTKALEREPTYAPLDVAPFVRIPRHLFGIAESADLQKANPFFCGIYAYLVSSDLQDPKNLVAAIQSASTRWEDMPDFLAVHGHCYIRKAISTDKGWSFTPFLDECTTYGLAQVGMMTGSLFYLDMMTQLANTHLNARYQFNLHNAVLADILVASPSWTFKA